MKHLALLTLIFCCLFAGQQASAQTPQINTGGVINGASFNASQPLAPGVIFSLFGTNLTDGNTAGAVDAPLPRQLAGARVLVNGTAAPLYYASPLQINAQFPVELTGLSSAQVQIEVTRTTGTVSSSPLTVSVAPVSPGIFTLNQNGSGPGAILRNSDFTKICPAGRSDCGFNPALRAEAVAIYLTGLGAVNGPWASGELAQQASPTVATDVVVTIGGIQTQALFSGLAAGFVGLYQVNVLVPANTPLGDSVPLTVTIAGRASNPVTIAIQPPTSISELGGPPGGTVRAVAMNPANPAIIYAGTIGGGVFKSANGGTTWSAANAGLTSRLVLSLAMDPSTPDTLYAGTIGGGIFKTFNGGTSWATLNSGLPVSSLDSMPPLVTSLAIDYRNPNTVYAGVFGTNEDGVYKSTNAGQSWTRASAGLSNAAVLTLAMDPSDPAVLYAGTSNGVFKTRDRGQSWTAVNSGLIPIPEITDLIGDASAAIVLSLAISPSNSSILYAGTLGNGIYKSTDGGLNWTAVNSGLPQVPYLAILPVVTSLAVDPSNPATVYAGISAGDSTDGVFKSTDGGQSWRAISFDLASSHVLALAIPPSSPSTVYAGTFGRGVFRSTNGGLLWNATNSGLAAGNIFTLARDPSGSGTVYAGTGNGLFKSTNRGQSWAAVSSGILNSVVTAVAVDPSNPSMVYAGTGLPGGLGSTGVFKSTNGGQTWTPASTGLPSEPLLSIVTSLSIDPSNAATLYAGTLGGVFKSLNGGTSWTGVNSGLLSYPSVQALAIDPVNSSTVYVGTYDGLFKSTNGGHNWAPANSGDIPLFPILSEGLSVIYSLAVDPANAEILYAGTFGTGVFKSTDGGKTWSVATSGLPAFVTLAGLPATPVVALTVDPSSPATMYVGTFGSGVFKSTDGGASWQPTGTE
ncbi:MAG: hypothetical protein HY647_09785 [Acidobacteria bacterium]|nr:hypothetical protein [Acidobacteriota bacterium]